MRAIRGEVLPDARPGRARDALVALQVTGSVLLLICAAIFLRSSWVAATIDPGIRTAGIVNVSVLDEQRRGAILEVVNTEPLVASVAASWPSFFGVLGSRPALAEGPRGKSAVTYQFVSPEHFGVLDIDLVRGRGFTQSEQSASAAVAVVSEKTAARVVARRRCDRTGPAARVGPETGPTRAGRSAVCLAQLYRRRRRTGCGGLSIGRRQDGRRRCVPADQPWVSEDVDRDACARRCRARAAGTLVDRLAAVDPNMAEVSTLETFARTEAYLLKIPFWLTLVLGALALLLTLTGLFSVLSYLVEQRAREIGVRMALGATSRGIAMLVLSQSARPVGIGLLLGGSLTAALGAVLLATPAAEAIGSTVRLFDPVAYGASLLSIVTACTCAALIPALRAARIDPVATLKQH